MQKDHKDKRLLQKMPRQAIKVLLVLLYTLVGFVTLYHVYFAKRIVPGVEISGVRVGGLTYHEAKSVLENKRATTDTSLKFSYGDEKYVFSSEEVPVEYNIDSTVARAFEVGRTGNLVIDTKDKLAGLLGPLIIKNYYSVDDSSLNAAILVIEGELNIAPEDAQFVLEGDEVSVNPAKVGQRIEDDTLYDAVVQDLDSMQFENREITVVPVVPEITEDMLRPYLEEIRSVVGKNIIIKLDKKQWSLTKEQLLGMSKVTVKEDNQTKLDLNNPAFESYAELLALEVNKLPKALVTELDGKKVKKFELKEKGAELHIDEFKKMLADALFKNDDQNISIDLPISEVTTLASPESYGIVELLGEGQSDYTGSSSARALNLNLAAERTNGVLVPPGEIYSLNNSVGEISAATGYASAYVISNGRTVLGDGGGVCQTSTTLFRAVLNSGLPVVKRNPHAYRVVYYERDMPAGFDAAIYQPSLDFQFKNDTQHHILLQTTSDKENNILKFQLFGTSDGREVSISEPVITNQTPPPEALYQDDNTLPKGTVRQVDFAAWGATSSFDRVVKRNGETIIEDNFTTRYQPWRAIYLVGTKE